MITVSSCGVKLQEVLSGLEIERLKHWRYAYTFVAFLNIYSFIIIIFSFYLGCNLGGRGGMPSDPPTACAIARSPFAPTQNFT